jgi:phosphatidylinositol alpha-mannosyltransferase
MTGRRSARSGGAGAGGALSVCLVSAAYLPYPSGVSEHVAHLAAELLRAGHRVDVLTTRHEGDPAPSSAGALAPSSAGEIPVTRVGRALAIRGNGSYATLPVGFSLPREVRAHLEETGPDVVHCHGFMFPEIAHWALRSSRGANVVSLMSAGFPSSRVAGLVYRTAFHGTVRRIAGTIALSEWAAECHRELLPGPFDIVPSGVDLARFRPDLAPLPDGVTGPVILFVGRLDARKGARVLLNAMPAVLDDHPESTLVMVGSGPQMDDCVRLAAQLGIAERVRFEGRVTRADLPRYYAGATVFVSPATSGESFGIVLLEALAAGTPVVASAIRGYDEVVRAGEGLLVPPGQPSVLAAAIARLLSTPDLRAQLARAGSRRAGEFAWPTIARRTVRVYERALTRTSL